MNLVLALLSTRQYLTAERIRGIVGGYAKAPSDEAFFRMFERDKTELRELGVPLETGRNSAFDAVEGYRIARRDYELGEISLTPDEAAAVGLAVRLWDSSEFTGQAHGALVKLRAAGVDVDQGAGGGVQPLVRTDAALSPLLGAVQSGHVVRFDYRRSRSPERRTRTLEPWGVVSWRGRWYVIGHDQDRQAPRCFRLSRIIGDVHVTRTPIEHRQPDDVDLLQFVGHHHPGDDRAPAATARVWAAKGKAAGIRRGATVVGQRTVGGVDGDLLELDIRWPDGLARLIAGQGPDVLVLEPDVLAKSVHERLVAVAGGDGGRR